MIPLWYQLVIGIWSAVVMVVVASLCGVFILVALRAFARHGIPFVFAMLHQMALFACDILARAWGFRRPVVVATSLTTLVIIAIGCQWYFFWDTEDVPDVMELVRYAPPQIGYVYDSRGQVMVELANVFRKPLAYEELSLPIEQATIAAEDKDFYEHDGIPILCLTLPFVEGQSCLPLPVELVWRWMSGKGGSTLTMQLARNHYLTDILKQERTTALIVDNPVTRLLASLKSPQWVNRRMRKLREMKYALHIERQMREYAQRSIASEMKAKGFWWPQRLYQSHALAKRRSKEILLARYLSTVYYGYSMYGPDSAARFYFNVSARELTAPQAATLASFEPAPSVFAQVSASPMVRAQQVIRRNRVLQRMGTKGFLYTAFDCGRPETYWDSMRWFFKAELPRGDCKDEVATYSAFPIRFVGRIPGGRTNAGASVLTALEEVVTLGFPHRKLFDGMIRLQTTVDMRIQAIVNAAARDGLHAYTEQFGAARGTPQMAIAVLRNRDAAILAQFGGFTRDIPNTWTNLDRTRKSLRQPGSIFKIFVYLAALESGNYTPDSLVSDSAPYPIRMGGGWIHYVHNYTSDYRGWIPFREALAQSRNVPAMHIGIEYTSLDTIIRVAHDVGITSPIRDEASIILGASDVSLMDLTNAFRTIASGGVIAKPYALERVTNSFGEELERVLPLTTEYRGSTEAIVAMQELLRGSVRLPSGTARSMNVLTHIPLLCKTGTSNRFADARATCSTYGPDGVTVGIWMGFDESTQSLGEGASGGRLALVSARSIFAHLYAIDGTPSSDAPLGVAPKMPDDMEMRISNYITSAYPQNVKRK